MLPLTSNVTHSSSMVTQGKALHQDHKVTQNQANATLAGYLSLGRNSR